MNERLENTPRQARVVVLEDGDDLAGLIEVWLARHGLKTVPIRGAGGHPVRPAVRGIGVMDTAEDGFAPEPSKRRSPTVVIVAEPGADVADTAEPWPPDMVQPQGTIPPAGYSDLDAWVDALREGLRSSERDHFRLGPLDISPARRCVRVGGSEVHLTPTEFRLLCYLVENADRVVGHAELLHSVWGAGYEDDIHLLQQTIRSLRARIAIVTERPLIESVYGVGYRMAGWPVETAQSS